MSKKNLIKDGTFTWEDKDGQPSKDLEGYVHILYITLDPDLKDDDGEVIYDFINSNGEFMVGEGRAAITSAADLLGHGKFDHPFTDDVLGTVFVRSNFDPASKLILNSVGFITEECQEKKYGRFNRRTATQGVNQLHRRGGYWVQGRVDDDAQARYAFWLQKHTLRTNTAIRVPAFLNERKVQEDGTLGLSWIQTILNNLAMEDAVEREQARDDAVAGRVQSQQRYRKVKKLETEVKQGKRELAGALTVKVFGTDEEVDALSLPPQTIKVHHKDGEARDYAFEWDTGVVSRLMMQDVAQYGHSIELKS